MIKKSSLFSHNFKIEEFAKRKQSLDIPSLEFSTPSIIESESEMADTYPLFLRTVTYNADTGKRKTEICTLSNRHQFTLDTSNTPLMPVIDGIPYLKSEKDQIEFINIFKDNPSAPHCFIIEAEIITLEQYNNFYLKTGCLSN